MGVGGIGVGWLVGFRVGAQVQRPSPGWFPPVVYSLVGHWLLKHFID